MSCIDHDIRSALAISNAVERMTALYSIAGELNEAVPFELSKQIEVYSHVLICIARLQASAQYDYGCAEAERKRVYGITLATTQGTAAQREGAAEQAAYDHRRREAHALAELTEWKSTFYATQELINAKKQTLHVLNRELGSTNGTGR